MIAVLMSTYNGENYLKEQIDSILNQTYSDFEIYIRDDGSTDGTKKIVESYNNPRIKYVQGENLGPSGSFFALLNMVPTAEFIFFSDQDDVWYPEKLEIMLEEIKKYEGIPTMVFSDFAMIDFSGKCVASSYSEYANLQVSAGSVGINKIIAQPYVFGCASVINRDLADMVLTPPNGIEMHDCWISLVAAAIGKLIYMPQQTIAHRFHSSNATGKSGQDSNVSRLMRVTRDIKAQIQNTKLRLSQVNLLLEELEEKINSESLEVLGKLSAAMKKGKVATVRELRKFGVSRQKKLNTLFFYLTVLFIKGDIS